MAGACDTAAAAAAWECATVDDTGAEVGVGIIAGTAGYIAGTAMVEGVAGGGVTASAYGCAAVAAVVTRSVDTVIVTATVTGAAGTAIFEDMAVTSDDMGATSVGTAGGGNPLRS
jgi:hypothetical protein